MNKIYFIRDSQDNPIKTYRGTWCYKTLNTAKTAAKNYIKNKNKKLPKNKRLSYDSIRVVECETLERDVHPL